jgi:hypothetical protein
MLAPRSTRDLRRLRQCRKRPRAYASPADLAALDSAQDRTEKHNVHQLAIVEALKGEREQETPFLVALEQEGDEARDEFDHKERGEEVEDALDVARGPELEKGPK